MDVFDSIYYIRIKKCMIFCGHWPYLSPKRQNLHQALLMLAVLTIVIPQTAKLLQLRHDFRSFILAIPSMFYYVEFICKSFFAARQGKKIKKVLEKIKHDFQVLKGKDLEIVKRYADMANKANTVYITCMFTVVSAYSVIPMALHVLDMAIPGNMTLLPEPPRLITYFSPRLDENISFIIVHGFLVDLASLVIMVAFDMLTFIFAYHVCGLFVVVSKKLSDSLVIKEKLKKASSCLEKIEYENIFYNNLRESVVLHQWALEFVEILESALSILNLLSIGCALVPLTIAEYGVIISKDNYGDLAQFAIFIFGEIGHSIYYNWPGQQIRDHSLLVHEACYDCEWYRDDVSDRCKKLLSFIMVKSQTPSAFSAGNLYILGLENFGAIIKLSMSYFTVLSSIM